MFGCKFTFFKRLLGLLTMSSRKRRRGRKKEEAAAENEEEKDLERVPHKKPRIGTEKEAPDEKAPSSPSPPKRKRSSEQLDGSKTGEPRQGKKKIKREEPVLDLSQSCSGHRRVCATLSADKFCFHHILGEGGFGKVMLATDVVRREQVAIKMQPKSKPLKSHLTERYILELSNECPFLVHGYGVFHTTSYVFYVMELVRGGSLAGYLKKTPKVDILTIQFLAAEIVCGIQFLHSKGIVHRDIKPGNILLSHDGHVKIADFGIALHKMLGGVTASKRCGTARYMAPEILQGRQYSYGVDWFAFGVTLYRMLTTTYPFSGKTKAEIGRAVIDKEPAYTGLDQDSTSLLKKLLCKQDSLRLGENENIRQQPFFGSINWADLEAGRTESPVTMPADDLSDFLNREIPVPYSEVYKNDIEEVEQRPFKNICFVGPEWAEDYTNTTLHSDVLPPDIAQDHISDSIS